MKSPAFKSAVYLFALSCALLTATANVPLHAADRVRSEVSAYEPPDPQAVHQHLQEILSQDRYKPKKSFIQHLSDFFFGFEGEAPRISSKVGWFFFWLLMIWCCVTLLAILAHFVWSIVTVSRRGTVCCRDTDAHTLEGADKTELELRALVQQMADAGDYHRAVKYLMLATLKRLDAKGILQFHASKTNGDYLRDFPRECNAYAGFMTCIAVFEKCIYGNVMTSQAAYHQMTTLSGAFEEIE